LLSTTIVIAAAVYSKYCKAVSVCWWSGEWQVPLFYSYIQPAVLPGLCTVLVARSGEQLPTKHPSACHQLHWKRDAPGSSYELFEPPCHIMDNRHTIRLREFVTAFLVYYCWSLEFIFVCVTYG